MSLLIAAALHAFVFSSKIDPFTDRQSHMVAMFADDMALAFKCDQPGEGSIYAVFSNTQYLGGGRRYNYRPLTIRFGTGGSITADWEYMDYSAVTTDQRVVAMLMERAFSNSKVAVRATRYDLETVTKLAEYKAAPDDAYALIKACDPAFTGSVKLKAPTGG